MLPPARHSALCATYVFNHCVEKNANKYPVAVRTVKNHFYIDNYIQSFELISNASNNVEQTFKSVFEDCFCLAKFVSDKPEVLENLPIENIEQSNDFVRVLGEKWNLSSDAFIMKPMKPNTICKLMARISDRKFFATIVSFDSIILENKKKQVFDSNYFGMPVSRAQTNIDLIPVLVKSDRKSQHL